MIKSAVSTDVGLRRTNNEDNYLKLDPFGLFAVADGMGGHAAGDVASTIAVNTLNIHRTKRGNPQEPSFALSAERTRRSSTRCTRTPSKPEWAQP